MIAFSVDGQLMIVARDGTVIASTNSVTPKVIAWAHK
jgi:hypothetical protein